MRNERKPLAPMGPRLGPKTQIGSQFSAVVRLGQASIYYKGQEAVTIGYRQLGSAEDPNKVLEVTFRDCRGAMVTHQVTVETGPIPGQPQEEGKIFHWVNLRHLPVCGFSEKPPQSWTGKDMRALSRWGVNCPKCVEALEKEKRA